MSLPEKLQKKIHQRQASHSFRRLPVGNALVDFSSNDYLGLARSDVLFERSHQYLLDKKICHNGSTGSRLLTGNHDLYDLVEKKITDIHHAQAALIYNSGYDANLGLISCIAQRDDVVLYDQLSHASIRDALQLCAAKTVAFRHNDLDHLQQKFNKHHRTDEQRQVYVITESVFSMDGDAPNLPAMLSLCERFGAHLIVDEAHALGVCGWGLSQKQGVHDRLFARIMTFGKGLGCHGAAILGSQDLVDYLVNFSRPFVYTTALPPHSLSTILHAYQAMQHLLFESDNEPLKKHICHFRRVYQQLGLQDLFIDSHTAIQSCVISQNNRVKSLAEHLQKRGFDVKPILAPTVPQGQERLRFCLHRYNSQHEITQVLETLQAQFSTTS